MRKNCKSYESLWRARRQRYQRHDSSGSPDGTESTFPAVQSCSVRRLRGTFHQCTQVTRILGHVDNFPFLFVTGFLQVSFGLTTRLSWKTIEITLNSKCPSCPLVMKIWCFWGTYTLSWKANTAIRQQISEWILSSTKHICALHWIHPAVFSQPPRSSDSGICTRNVEKGVQAWQAQYY